MSGMSMLSAFSSEGALENASASSKSFPGIWEAVNEYLETSFSWLGFVVKDHKAFYYLELV